MATIDAVPATQRQRDTLLALMRDHLADELESTMALIDMTWPQFEDRYNSVGEVRTLVHKSVEEVQELPDPGFLIMRKHLDRSAERKRVRDGSI